MSERDLCASFRAEQFEGRDIPSHSTVQRRLNGESLDGRARTRAGTGSACRSVVATSGSAARTARGIDRQRDAIVEPTQEPLFRRQALR
ncbi:hypothetical protein BAY61_24565 [Prauserella marina]|nr:hypothetical protein BAY61_24565 [Prauserella marina]